MEEGPPHLGVIVTDVGVPRYTPGSGWSDRAPGVTQLRTPQPYHRRCGRSDDPMAHEADPRGSAVARGDPQSPCRHRLAACRGVGVRTFVAGVGSQYEDLPRQLCAGCPVRSECLQTALADDSLQGFWGGTTPAERKQMRRGSAVA